MRRAVAWPARSVAATSGRFGGGREPRPPGADAAEALREPHPRPGLDLGVPDHGLSARGLEVLEPRVGLLDQEDLERLAAAGLAHRGESLGPGSDGKPLG